MTLAQAFAAGHKRVGKPASWGNYVELATDADGQPTAQFYVFENHEPVEVAVDGRPLTPAEIYELLVTETDADDYVSYDGLSTVVHTAGSPP